MSLRSESETAVDAEHQVQLALARAFCDAVREGGDAAQAREVINQLADYCDVHFLSEQLLMRLCSYPEYHEHVADHVRTMDELRGIAAALDAGEKAVALQETEELVGVLSRHMATRDQRFADYHAEWTRRAADLAQGAPDLPGSRSG